MGRSIDLSSTVSARFGCSCGRRAMAVRASCDAGRRLGRGLCVARPGQSLISDLSLTCVAGTAQGPLPCSALFVAWDQDTGTVAFELRLRRART